MATGSNTVKTVWARHATRAEQITEGSGQRWSGVSVGDLRAFLAEVDEAGIHDSVQVRIEDPKTSHNAIYASAHLSATQQIQVGATE